MVRTWTEKIMPKPRQIRKLKDIFWELNPGADPFIDWESCVDDRLTLPENRALMADLFPQYEWFPSWRTEYRRLPEEEEPVEFPQTQLPRFTRLDATTRRAINRELSDLDTYHSEIPLDPIFSILKRHGVIPLQEDCTEWAGIVTGREGRATFKLGDRQRSTRDSAIVFYAPYSNTVLVLTWHRMASGRYEINAYLS